MFRKLFLAAGLAVAPALSLAGPLGPFTDLVVFGDSLSDPGNIFATTGGAVPDTALYPNGQFTNGDTWATQLGADVASGTNFAFGGAKARTDDDGVPDFAAQRALFQGASPTLGDTPLTVVWLGGNDMLAAFEGTITIENAIQSAVGSIIAGVNELVGAGLRDILVFGLPNLGRLPDVVAAGAEAIAASTAATQAYNAALQGALAVRASTGNVRYFDVFAVFESIFDEAADLGFVNTTQACLAVNTAATCAGDAGFIFHDTIHPTDAVHARLADAVRVAVIPLPAGVWLLLSGLGGLVLLRRRRAG